jgi:hypothetical protein
LDFAGWLRQQVDRHDAVGELGRNLSFDECAPIKASAERLAVHLTLRHGATAHALAVLQQAREEYLWYWGLHLAGESGA